MQSIKFRITLIVVLGVLVGCLGVGYQFHRIHQMNLDLASRDSLRQSLEGFRNLRHDSVNLMTAAVEALLGNPELSGALAAQDREGLLAASRPLYDSYHERYGITHWNYWEPEPTGETEVKGLRNFLRAATPEKYGEFLERATLAEVVRTKDYVNGLDLGNTGFALRVIHPVVRDGKVCGYFELGQDISSFLKSMKTQSGDEYALALEKSRLDEKKWTSSRTTRGLSNNWNDMPDLVLAANTTQDGDIFSYDGSLTGLPGAGTTLGLVHRDDRIYTRGAFPLADATGQVVGGVFVLRDITATYAQMRQAQTQAILMISGLLALVGAGMIFIFRRLIVARLDRMIEVATRVVGGEYETVVVPSAKDEIGRFEALFEQFRQVFVGLIREVEDRDRRAA